MDREELRRKRIGILGFGINNKDLAVFLAKQGIAITVRERSAAKQQEFQTEYPELAALVKWEITEKTLDRLVDFDIVFRSPSIPFLAPKLQSAAKKGVEIYSQTKLFFDLCPAQIIGVTGTKGKGTTSSLIYRILEKGYTKGNVYLAGNIGVDPFSFFDQLTVDDVVVLELSSFQIQDLHKSPHIAVMLSVGTDHLDHHKTIAEYHDAKRQLLMNQGLNDIAIINVHEPDMKMFVKSARGKVYTYDRFHASKDSAWAHKEGDKETIFVQVGGSLDSFDDSTRLLQGDHNLDNILPAVLVGGLYDISMRDMQAAVTSFSGLPHRLHHVGTYEEVAFYDDSIATNTSAAQAALEAFPGKRIHLIAGGNDKGESYQDFAAYAVKRCATISILPGTATKKLLPELKKAASRLKAACLILEGAREPWMPTILSGIQPHIQPGDVVVLSPAATGFGAFADYKDRGDRFEQAVRERYDKQDI